MPFSLLVADNNPVDTEGREPDFIESLTITPNPTGYAPLTAELSLSTSRPVQVELLVPGRNGEMTDVRHLFEGMSQSMTIPVLGMYQGANRVTVFFYDEGGALLGGSNQRSDCWVCE